jgi:hypothetical protein
MGARTALVVTVLMAAGLLTGLAVGEEKPSAKVIEGELVDLQCYSAGGARGEKHAACAKKCMASGIPAGVAAEDRTWTLATNPVPLADHAAKTVRVTGKANEKTGVLMPEKIEVKDGDTWSEVQMKDAHRS